MVYAARWSFVGALSWTTAAVYLVREVGMTPLQLVLTGTALEVSYFLFEIPTGVVADLYSRRLSLVIAAVVSGRGDDHDRRGADRRGGAGRGRALGSGLDVPQRCRGCMAGRRDRA